MAVPKYKTSKSKKRKRRTHDKLTPPHLVPCGNCGQASVPHAICPTCGHYRVHRKGKSASTRQVLFTDGVE